MANAMTRRNHPSTTNHRCTAHGCCWNIFLIPRLLSRHTYIDFRLLWIGRFSWLPSMAMNAVQMCLVFCPTKHRSQRSSALRRHFRCCLTHVRSPSNKEQAKNTYQLIVTIWMRSPLNGSRCSLSVSYKSQLDKSITWCNGWLLFIGY
jgi:hypothetical protein